MMFCKQLRTQKQGRLLLETNIISENSQHVAPKEQQTDVPVNSDGYWLAFSDSIAAILFASVTVCTRVVMIWKTIRLKLLLQY